MAHELNQLPSQCKINIEQLIKENDDYLTGLSLIKKYIKEQVLLFLFILVDFI